MGKVIKSINPDDLGSVKGGEYIDPRDLIDEDQVDKSNEDDKQ